MRRLRLLPLRNSKRPTSNALRSRGDGTEPECGEGGTDKHLNARGTLWIADNYQLGSAVALEGLLFSAKLGEQVSARELEERIRRKFFDERGDHRQGIFVTPVIAVEIEGEIEASDVGNEHAVGDGHLNLADTILLRASGNSHEEAQDSGNGPKRIDVIIVEAETQIGIGEIGIERECTEKMIPGADACPRAVASFPEKSIEPRGHGVTHTRIEVHFRGFVLFDLGVRQLRDFCGELEEVLIGRKFWPASRIGHSPFEIGRLAPDLPPERFVFEKIAERLIWLFLLHPARGFQGGQRVAGIDLSEDSDGLRRRGEFCGKRLGQ